MVEDGEIRVVHRGGSRINFRIPVISNDSRFLICTSGESVKVFSTSTEECVHELHGHTDLVTGVILKPSNHLQVFSCSLDGTVRLWDFTDGILIKTYVIGTPLHAIYASEDHQGFVFIVIPAVNDKQSDHFQLVGLQLPQSPDQLVEAQQLSAVLSSVRSEPAAIAFGRGGEYIASVRGLTLEVYFFRKQKSNWFSLKEDNKKGGRNTFVCVACHPKDDCICTGHEDGKIRLWRNFTCKKTYTYTTVHWHHSAVSSLVFTPEGTSLLSGGVESVLVQWRYQQENQKDFLPRLGAAITHVAVSPDGSLFCTSHADNKIQLIHGGVKVSAVIQGLVKGEHVLTDVMVDPRSKALVLNGKPGHLQFYSLQRDQLLFNLDVVQQEFIHQADLQQFDVVKAAFDVSGNWLATVEERKLDDAEPELHLKLWAFNEQAQSFELNTTISSPHEDTVTSMCFSQAADVLLLASCSKDGHFCVWQQVSPTSSEDEPSWSCDFVGTYHELVPECCSFSADGSLLAVAFQEVVTVWSTTSWELLTTLSQPPGAIRNLCFGQRSSSRFLVGASDQKLLCWNLLACSLEWSTNMDVSLLLADAASDHMAAFCHQAGCSDLFVFKPSEPRPLFSQKAVCSGKVTRATFGPRDDLLDSCQESSQWLNCSHLYFLTADMDLLTFTTKEEERRRMASSRQLMLEEKVAPTPFQLLLGKQGGGGADSASSTGAEQWQLPRGSAAVGELLQTPAHVLPSPSVLCAAFIESLLVSTANREESQSDGLDREDQDQDQDQDQDSDSEEEMKSSSSKPEQSQTGPTESDAPPLTKAQLRELKRLRKLDYSWSNWLLDC